MQHIVVCWSIACLEKWRVEPGVCEYLLESWSSTWKFVEGCEREILPLGTNLRLSTEEKQHLLKQLPACASSTSQTYWHDIHLHPTYTYRTHTYSSRSGTSAGLLPWEQQDSRASTSVVPGTRCVAVTYVRGGGPRAPQLQWSILTRTHSLYQLLRHQLNT